MTAGALASGGGSVSISEPEEGARPNRCCSIALVAADRPRRYPASTPADRRGTRGFRYPADPPKIEEIIAVMRTAGDDAHGRRLRGLIVVLWRAGLRIQEALPLAEGDLDHGRGALVVRRDRGGRRREVGMDAWGWDELQPWLDLRVEHPVGPLFCVLNGWTCGRQ